MLASFLKSKREQYPGPPVKPVELFVLQPTPFSNVNCDYCYLPNRGDKQRMSMETIEVVFTKLFASPYVGERITVVWHAGEPLVLPVTYYEEAFSIIDRLCPDDVAIDHSFQSNGLLLTLAWVDFIKQRRIRIGLCIDGPDWLHDQHRKTRSGKGTHDVCMKAVGRLQKAGVDFHVITVLTADSLAHPQEIFEFFRDHRMHHIGFNVEEIEADNVTSSLEQPDAVERYKVFLRAFLARNKAAGNPIELREASALLALVLGPAGLGPDNIQCEALRILCVDAEGNLSGFLPELLGVKAEGYDDFLFGNLHDLSLDDAVASSSFQRMQREILAGVERCRSDCSYFSVCGGGAPGNKFFENGSFDTTETQYCRLTKQAVTDVMLNELEDLFEITGRVDRKAEGWAG